MSFSRSLVLWFSRTRRQHRKSHVIGKVAVSRIDIGIVEVGLVNPAFEIVYYQMRRHSAEIGKHPLVQSDKGR